MKKRKTIILRFFFLEAILFSTPPPYANQTQYKIHIQNRFCDFRHKIASNNRAKIGNNFVIQIKNNLYKTILKGVIKMCGENCERNSCGCLCSKMCAIAKFIFLGMVIGSAAGMVLMYFYDHDRWMQSKARKMVSGVKDAAQNMASGIKSTIGMGEEN